MRRWWCAISHRRLAGGYFSARADDATDLNTGKQYGAPTPSRAPGEPGTRLEGRQGALNRRGSVWGDRDYDAETDTSIQGIAMPAGWIRNTGRATANGQRACSLGASDGKIKWGYQLPPTTLRLRRNLEHPLINAKINGEDRKLVCMPRATASTTLSTATNGSFVLASNTSTS